MFKQNGFEDTLVIVATLNEEAGVGPTLTEVNNSLKNPLCLVVDGRSTDRTVEVAKECGAQILFQKGAGKGDAIATAIGHSKGLKVKYVALIDADYTYPAKYLSTMVRILEAGSYSEGLTSSFGKSILMFLGHKAHGLQLILSLHHFLLQLRLFFLPWTLFPPCCF